jgi:hypothetical protein
LSPTPKDVAWDDFWKEVEDGERAALSNFWENCINEMTVKDLKNRMDQDLEIKGIS